MEFETNYLRFILANGKPIRWTKKIISVYIDICSIYEHQRENVVQRIGDSFYAWYQALDGKLNFEWVNDKENADINIRCIRNFTSGILGRTHYTKIENSGEIKKINITLGLQHCHIFVPMCIHEIGHALGLYGHSVYPYNKDLMFSELIPHYNAKLTQRDINTINLLYEMPLEGLDADEIMNITVQDETNKLSEYSNEQNEQEDLILNCEKIGIIKLYEQSLKDISLSFDVQKYIERRRF